MAAPGETDLAKMLASLRVERRPGIFTYLGLAEPAPELIEVAHAVVVEDESTTLVVPVDAARQAGFAVEIEMAWLSLTVQSSLEAVGLTASFAATLGEHGIPCNVLAGYHHDHILVPVGRAEDAIAALTVSSS